MGIGVHPETGATSRLTTSAAVDFRFLPTQLTSRCSQLIKAHHGAKGYWNLPDLLWHEETREFIAKQANLQLVFISASIARSPKKAQRGRKCEAERPCRLLIYQQLELRRQVAKLAGRRPQVPP